MDAPRWAQLLVVSAVCVCVCVFVPRRQCGCAMAEAHVDPRGVGETLSATSEETEELYPSVPEEYAKMLREKDAQIKELHVEVEEFALKLFEMQPASPAMSMASMASARRLQSMRNLGGLRNVPRGNSPDQESPRAVTAASDMDASNMSGLAMPAPVRRAFQGRRKSAPLSPSQTALVPSQADEGDADHDNDQSRSWRDQLTSLKEEYDVYRSACIEAEAEVEKLEAKVETLEQQLATANGARSG
eukprot:TRINITY_DN2988_c0_g1_i1.p1 TRINITY_DN2988_c0_g1~~TRINITY_DN2988_c0_g1_i1.p1  ORF type:complete len:245 (+),score=49.72 TRINITY_DN2988_c0_g1_i1:80-814(+)